MQKQAHKAVAKLADRQRAKARNRGGRGFCDDSADREPEFREEEPDVECIESADDEDDACRGEDEEENAALPEGEPRPASRVPVIWLWSDGRILWSGNNFGYHVAPREHLRWTLHKILDYINEYFKISPEDPLSPLVLAGFFTKERLSRRSSSDRKAASWIEHLDRAGILIEGLVYPLSTFINGQGQASTSLPGRLEQEWLLRECRSRGVVSLDWKTAKEWLPAELGTFCIGLNGIAGTRFGYAESTVQRKKLGGWKKWLEEDLERGREGC